MATKTKYRNTKLNITITDLDGYKIDARERENCVDVYYNGTLYYMAFANSTIEQFYDTTLNIRIENSSRTYVRDGEASCFNHSHVRVDDFAKCCAHDESQVLAIGHAEVCGYDTAKVSAHSFAQVWGYGHSEIKAFSSCKVNVCDSAKVDAFDKVEVNAYDTSTANMYSASMVRAFDRANVIACDFSIVETRSDTVNVVRKRKKNKSKMIEVSYWVDFNNNKWDKEHFSEEEAERLSAHCATCESCTNCDNCDHCIGCSDCNGCKDCIACEYCSQCVGCKDGWCQTGMRGKQE